MATELETVYLYSDYDIGRFYSEYSPSTLFYKAAGDFYTYNEFLDNLGYPVPNLFKAENYKYLEQYSCVLETPIVRAGLLFSVFMTVVGGLALIYFMFSYMKSEGYAGFEWNFDSHNIEPFEPMKW